jgi:hypothetical protein
MLRRPGGGAKPSVPFPPAQGGSFVIVGERELLNYSRFPKLIFTQYLDNKI